MGTQRQGDANRVGQLGARAGAGLGVGPSLLLPSFWSSAHTSSVSLHLTSSGISGRFSLHFCLCAHPPASCLSLSPHCVSEGSPPVGMEDGSEAWPSTLRVDVSFVPGSFLPASSLQGASSLLCKPSSQALSAPENEYLRVSLGCRSEMRPASPFRLGEEAGSLPSDRKLQG